MKKNKKIICLTLTVLLLLLSLTGCGPKDDSFQVMFAASFVNEELVASYNEQLPQDADPLVKCSSFSFGSEDVDPTFYASGAMAMSAMLSAGEVDVMVCDLENAVRYARSGAFYDLTEIFTPEELAEFGDSALSFDIIDPYGNLTGEKTPVCGLDLSGRDALTRIMGDEHYGVFIVCSAGDIELAKQIVRELLSA